MYACTREGGRTQYSCTYLRMYVLVELVRYKGFSGQPVSQIKKTCVCVCVCVMHAVNGESEY
jgi:hypothetical protein